MSMTQTETASKTRQTAPVSERTRDAMILVTVLLALVAWGVSVALWGIPGLYIPALAMVPVIWVVLIIISRG